MLKERQPRLGESKTISVCAIIFVVIGIVIFQIFGNSGSLIRPAADSPGSA